MSPIFLELRGTYSYNWIKALKIWWIIQILALSLIFCRRTWWMLGEQWMGTTALALFLIVIVRPFFLSVSLPVNFFCAFVCLSVVFCLYAPLSVHVFCTFFIPLPLSVSLYVHVFCLFVCLSIYFVHLSVYLLYLICLSVCPFLSVYRYFSKLLIYSWQGLNVFESWSFSMENR